MVSINSSRFVPSLALIGIMGACATFYSFINEVFKYDYLKLFELPIKVYILTIAFVQCL